jgi:hypothetical protein
MSQLPYPSELLPVFQKSVTCEYASLTAKGAPITFPVTPYMGQKTLDISTGLTYPSKAERARRNSKVTLLYSDPVGSGLQNPPVVLVYGHGAVRDSNLQANTDRYVGYVSKMIPMPPFVLRRMTFYFARIWVEITPLKILWWENGDLDAEPKRWDAPAGVELPASDPAPQGKDLGRWKEAPQDWREGAAYAVQNLGIPVLTVVDEDGYPVSFRVKGSTLVSDGFELTIGKGIPTKATGKACLTFHTHPEVFTGQENIVFLGEMHENGLFKVERRPGDWSLPPKGIGALTSFFASGLKLRPRLKAEAERRGQPVPKVRLPGDS